MKRKHWRGFPGKTGWKSAPVLVFARRGNPKTSSSQRRLGPSPIQDFEKLGGLDSSARRKDESWWFQEVPGNVDCAA